jgi:hypothetical protein
MFTNVIVSKFTATNDKPIALGKVTNVYQYHRFKIIDYQCQPIALGKVSNVYQCNRFKIYWLPMANQYQLASDQYSPIS